MKKIIVFFTLAMVSGLTSKAQVQRDAQIPPATKPVYNPFQFTNYYQNNSMFNNNSTQTNAPVNPNAASYPGNGTYVDPTRYPVNSSQGSGNSTYQLPVNGVGNNNGH